MKDALKSSARWLYAKRQPILNSLVLLITALYFVYTLGYATNWAGVVTESRGANFFRASQQANRLMVDLGFITIILVLLNMAFGSFKRAKYYLSNFLLSILTIIMMVVQSAITIYYNGVLERMYQRLTEEEIPPYLYITHGAGEKSYAVFEQGNILAVIMIIVALLFAGFIIQKKVMQVERTKLIKELLYHEH
ncbi:MAG TPA: hypothetical protein PLP48_00555 [Acholeplasmataceae bacterium]|nr:hypothetical protein [Acholeplasmataceae bacterium]